MNYSKGNYVKAKQLSMLIDWELLICNNVIDGWNNSKSVLLDIRNKFLPLTNEKMSKFKWITRKVIKCRRAKCKAWKKYCKIRYILRKIILIVKLKLVKLMRDIK